MEVQGPGGVSGPNRIDPQKVPVQGTDGTGDAARAGDRVEISEHTRLLEKLSQVPSIRTEKIQELKKLIESGRFESPERIEGAVQKLLEELGLTQG